MNFSIPALSEAINTCTNSVPEVYDFIVHDPHFYNEIVFRGLYESIFNFTFCIGNAIQAFSVVIYFLCIIILKLIFLSSPHLMSLGNAIIEFHKTQLGFWDMVVEAILIVTILLLLIFRKRIVNAWRRFEANLAKKSRTLARIFPHLLFFTTAALFSFFGQKFLLPLASTRALPLFTLVIPLVRTMNVMRLGQEASYRDVLVMWIVMSIYYSLCLLAESIPFSGILLSVLPMLREFTLVVSTTAIIYCPTTPHDMF